MNAIAKNLTHQILLPNFFSLGAVSKAHLKLLTLALVVLLSAISVVYVKDMNRCLVEQSNMLQLQDEQLHNEWSQLLLEQSALSSQARVEKIAQNKLQMQMPDSKSVVVVQMAN